MERRELLRRLGAGLAGVAGLGAWPVSAGGLTARRAPRQDSGHVLVRGGRVFHRGVVERLDLRIREGVIREVGPDLAVDGALVLDAGGLLALPGGIDPHTHLSAPWVDDFHSGSRAALAGGITTLGHMTYPRDSETLLQAVEREELRALRESICDVMLHPVVVDPTPARLRELPALAAAGHTSIKVYMVIPGFAEAVPEFLSLFREARRHGLLTMIHCEDGALIQDAVARLEARGHDGMEHFARSRPVTAEEVATQEAAAFCEATGAPMYVVHLASARALAVASRARARGLPFFVETRPLYLHFTDEVFTRSDGPLFVGQPPIRSEEDQAALWEGLADGRIDVVATDHAPWTREQKMDPTRTIANPRAGVNNLQLMLPLLYSEGVAKDRISLERFVEVTSTLPARIFGLHPRKGSIRVGADGDVVLWNTGESRTVRSEDAPSAAGFSVYDGWQVTGWPVVTLRRGRMVFSEGSVQEAPGSGRVAPRDPVRHRDGPYPT